MVEDLVTRSRDLLQKVLDERGPTNPRAMYRLGSKPNQAVLFRQVREFLNAYASAGNRALQREKIDVADLEAKAAAIRRELDDLLKAARELSP